MLNRELISLKKAQDEAFLRYTEAYEAMKEAKVLGGEEYRIAVLACEEAGSSYETAGAIYASAACKFLRQ
jgi:hypothetical protein